MPSSAARFLSSVAALGFGLVLAIPGAHASGVVKAMTFNVRCPCGDQGQYAWAVRKDLVVDVIRKYQADFVGTQENVAEYLPFLKAQLTAYAYFGRGREANGGGEGTQLFYLKDRWEIVGRDSGTFQMSATPQVWGSRTWSSLPRVTTWALFREKPTGRLLYVYNTHWDHQTGRDEFSWMTADTLSTRRLKDVPLLLMGDFNRTQDTPPIRYLLGQVTAYPGRVPPVSLMDTHPATVKIDHVLTWPRSAQVDSLPMQVLEAKVIGDRYTVGSYTNVSPSDHDPTWVHLRVWKEDPVSLAGAKAARSRSGLRVSFQGGMPTLLLHPSPGSVRPDGRAAFPSP